MLWEYKNVLLLCIMYNFFLILICYKMKTASGEKYLENKIKEYISKTDMLYEDKFRSNILGATHKRLSMKQ